MGMRKLILPVMLLAGLICRPVCGTTPDLKEALDYLRSRTAGVATIASDFVQEKYLAAFNDKVVAHGRFYYARADRLRWELTAPVTTGFVLNGQKGRRWNDRQAKPEPFDIRQEPMLKIIAGQLLAWARADFEQLDDIFDIALVNRQPVCLRLSPREAGKAGPVDSLTILFADDGAHVQQVEIFEKGGDKTLIRFENTLINSKLAEGLF
jgi:outer membrane lipoprotein-sorting protein